MVPSSLPGDLAEAGQLALTVINNLEEDIAEVHNNLLHAKIQQAHHASLSRSPDPNYAIRDFVMLSTFNH
jgi:hypothetical protein